MWAIEFVSASECALGCVWALPSSTKPISSLALSRENATTNRAQYILMRFLLLMPFANCSHCRCGNKTNGMPFLFAFARVVKLECRVVKTGHHGIHHSLYHHNHYYYYCCCCCSNIYLLGIIIITKISASEIDVIPFHWVCLLHGTEKKRNAFLLVFVGASRVLVWILYFDEQ